MLEPTEIDRRVDEAIAAIPGGAEHVQLYAEQLSKLLSECIPTDAAGPGGAGELDTMKCFALAVGYAAASVVIGGVLHAKLPLDFARLIAESFYDQICNDKSRAEIIGALQAAVLEGPGHSI